MISLNEILRPSILKLKAYSSARSLTKDLETQNNKGMTNSVENNIKNTSSLSHPSHLKIFFDANENFQAPAIDTEDSISSLAHPNSWESKLNRYPNPQPPKLLDRFSELYQVHQNQILITRGSDEAIDILSRAVLEPKEDSIVIQSPTYGMYQVSAEIQNAKIIDVPLIFKDHTWVINFENLSDAISNHSVKIIYICSPNNPTGTLFSNEDIERCIDLLKPKTLLVLDQAYIEFTNSILSQKILNHPQVVILRTLSKAWGLAGLRLGCLIAHPDLILVLQKVLAPYPIPTAVSEIVQKKIDKTNEVVMKKNVNEIIELRERLKVDLLNLKCVEHVFSSSTNFLLVKFKDAKKTMDYTLKNNLVLRDRSSTIQNCIRITVGSKLENAKLIQVLTEMP